MGGQWPSRKWVRGATKQYEAFPNIGNKRRPDGLLMSAPTLPALLRYDAALIQTEFTVTPFEQSHAKVQKLTCDLVQSLLAIPQRHFALGLLFHKDTNQKYVCEFMAVDRECKQRSTIYDCFETGLPQLIVLVGVLTYCDYRRLGFLPLFRGFNGQSKERTTPSFDLTLTDDQDVKMTLFNGAQLPLQCVASERQSPMTGLFGRGTAVYAAELATPLNAPDFALHDTMLIKEIAAKWTWIDDDRDSREMSLLRVIWDEQRVFDIPESLDANVRADFSADNLKQYYKFLPFPLAHASFKRQLCQATFQELDSVFQKWKKAPVKNVHRHLEVLYTFPLGELYAPRGTEKPHGTVI